MTALPLSAARRCLPPFLVAYLLVLSSPPTWAALTNAAAPTPIAAEGVEKATLLVAGDAEKGAAGNGEAEEDKALQARREVFESVMVVRRDAEGALVSVLLFKDLPRHHLALFLPAHKLEIAQSEQVIGDRPPPNDGVDAGVVDAGVVEAGVVDAGVVDAGVVDDHPTHRLFAHGRYQCTKVDAPQSCRQVILLGIIFAGSVMPAYRSLSFAFAQVRAHPSTINRRPLDVQI
jgi:hypothetical protein